jgi:hypothetical protein
MLRPAAGSIEVLGGTPACGPAQLSRVGYVAQDAPTYGGMTVAEYLRLGAALDPLARRRRLPAGRSPLEPAGGRDGRVPGGGGGPARPHAAPASPRGLNVHDYTFARCRSTWSPRRPRSRLCGMVTKLFASAAITAAAVLLSSATAGAHHATR